MVFKKAWDIAVEEGSFAFPQVKDRPKALLKFVGLGFSTLGRLFPERAAKVAYDLIFTPRKNSILRLKKSPIPPAAKKLTFTSDEGTLLLGFTWGQGNKIALLIHDFELDASSLFDFVPALLHRGFKVIAFDAPAHGCSEGITICLPRYGKAIAKVINQLDTVDTIISHGLGGASVSFALRLVIPEFRLRNLVIISTPSNISSLLDQLTQLLQLPGTVKTQFFQLLEKIGQASIKEFNTAHERSPLNVEKILVVHDKDNQQYTYGDARENFFSWTNASLLTTTNLGHFGPLQHQKVIEEIITFINQEQVALN